MEGEKTKLMISTQRQRVVEKEAETERKKAVIDAEKESYVAKIQYEKLIMEKESMQKMAKIQDEMHLVRNILKNNLLILPALIGPFITSIMWSLLSYKPYTMVITNKKTQNVVFR